MPDLPTADTERHNQEALAELCRLLRFSQGEFALILVVCNSTQHREQLVAQLRQQCPITFDEVTLPPTTATLFTTLRNHVGQPPPEALMVYGLDTLEELDQVFTATNQIREEFRQFSFPLVLWLTDDGLKHLIRTSPDFYTWANPITLETPPQAFLAFLDDLIQHVWQQVLKTRENRFLSNQELGLTPNSPKCRELETSLAVLADLGIEMAPHQLADLAFVRGRIADNNTPTAREYYESSLDQWQTLLSANGATPAGNGPSRVGYIQFYLGIWWLNHAGRYRRNFELACEMASGYFQASVETFIKQGVPTEAARYINYWAESLQRLKRWSDLEAVAHQALTLHQQQQDGFRLARAESFLAEIAIAREDWPTAQRYAESALTRIHPAQTETTVTIEADNAEKRAFLAWVNSYHRSWYLFALARAQFHQDQLDAAVQTLEQALTITQPEYDPELYSRVLEQLRQGYFQQGKYLEAFETRRLKDEIESRFNYRAFVGAGRLQPKQQITNPALPTEVNPQDVIVSSGRKHDVHRLMARLTQDEYVLTIVHGPSGVGKSSLIEAGLVPALEQTRFDTRRVLPVYLRRYRDWLGDLVAALKDSQPSNIDDFQQAEEGGRTLTPKSGGLENTTADRHVSGEDSDREQNLPVSPLKNETEEGFSNELDKANIDYPQIFSLLRQQTQQNRVVVLVFDQFEEFFFECQETAQRRGFYTFLRGCLAMPFVKVVLSLREDYIHYLLECDRLTDLDIIDNNILDKKWLYYLDKFSVEDTKNVFQDLTAPTPYSPEPEMIDHVVSDLAAGTGEVRPIELQVVGAQLQAEGITTPGDYLDWGDPKLPTKELLVQKYLKDIVQECGLTKHQQLAEMVLYLLTDEQGTRPLKTASDLTGDVQTLTHEAMLEPTALELVLQILTRSGLVIEIPELPEDRYQLVHDYLADFIRSSQQPLMKQIEQERKMRLAAERKQLRQTRFAAVSLGALAIVSATAGSFAWIQQQKALTDKINAQVSAESLEMEAYLEKGLDEAAVTQAMLTGQMLNNEISNRLKPEIYFRALSAMREVIYEARERQRLIGHKAQVFDVDFDPKGQLIASASRDGVLKLWNLEGEELQTFRGHSDAALSIEFSPDGQYLTSSGRDNTVKLWNREGKLIQTLEGHDDWVWDAVFSPDGQTIASASSDHTVKLWSLDGEELQTLRGHGDWVWDVAFSPDGQTIASASSDHTVKLWGLDGEELQTLRGHDELVFGVAFSPDGQTIATTSRDMTVKLWNPDGTELKTLTGHREDVLSVDFSVDGQTIATTSRDAIVKLWSSDGRELQAFEGHSAAIRNVAFHPTNDMLATASWDGSIKIWSPSGEKVQTLPSDGSNDVAFSPNGEMIAVASWNGVAELWSIEGKKLRRFDGHSNAVQRVAFSPDGQVLATASWDGTAKLWDLDGNEIKTLHGHRDEVLSVAFSPDSSTIATASRDNTVKLWNYDGEQLNTFEGHDDDVWDVAFSPDGQRVATASSDNTVKLWTKDGRELQTLKGHENDDVLSVVFSPDGQILASASADDTVKLWNHDGQELETLRGHTGNIWRIAFSLDSQILATASSDDTIKLWSLSGQELQTLNGHDSDVWGIAFSPDSDNSVIATASNDNTVKLWNFKFEDLLARGCDWLSTYLIKQKPELLIDLVTCQQQNPAWTKAAAPNLLIKADRAVQDGKEESARQWYRQASQWDSDFNIDPTNRIEKILAVEDSFQLLEENNPRSAINSLQQLETFQPPLDQLVTKRFLNRFCREGSLQGYASEVMFACENAVRLDPSDGKVADSRGLARALTKDFQGAISDFNVFIEATADMNNKMQRQEWINSLERGENPFTPELLEELRNE